LLKYVFKLKFSLLDLPDASQRVEGSRSLERILVLEFLLSQARKERKKWIL
jgi:hypothetical protein